VTEEEVIDFVINTGDNFYNPNADKEFAGNKSKDDRQ